MVQLGRPTEARKRCIRENGQTPRERPVVNSLLLSIPDVEFHVIRPHLEFVSLPQRSSLHEANTKLEDAYFLNTGMVSLVFTAG